MHISHRDRLKERGPSFLETRTIRDFPGRIVFLDVNTEINSFTGDRTEYLGRNGSMVKPAALVQERLSNRVGAAMDPCAALQVKIDLAEGQEGEIISLAELDGMWKMHDA